MLTAANWDTKCKNIYGTAKSLTVEIPFSQTTHSALCSWNCPEFCRFFPDGIFTLGLNKLPQSTQTLTLVLSDPRIRKKGL